jgi:outer membrane protein assembly factor BamB
VIRALAMLAALVVAVSACTSNPDERVSEPPPPADPAPTDELVPGPKRIDALITVVDGDTYRRVDGATVSIVQRSGRSDHRGLASVPLARRAALPVRISAAGYIPRRLLLRFQVRHQYTIRLFQRRLQWPLFGANPARTQAHPAIELRPPFRVVWSRGFGSLIEHPAIVWEGVAYVNSLRGFLTAVSMRDGRVLWRAQVGSRMASSPGLSPARRELVTTSMSPGYVSVVDMRTGRIKWRYYTGRAEPSPLVLDRVAYLAAANGNVYALDLETHRPRWIHRTGVKITGSPALAGGRLYLGDYAGRVLALDLESGRRLWTGSAGSRVYGTLAVAGGRVFAPSVFSGLSALSARTGRLLWRVPVGAYLYSSPAVYRGRVYFGTYAGYVYAASARSGRILWSRSATGAVSGAVQVVAGVVYAGSFGARITGWDWRTGRTLWSFPHGEYVPVSGNGGRLLMHGYSRIWALAPAR